MPRPSLYYRIMDHTGAVVAEGTQEECAEQIGISVSHMRHIIEGVVGEHKYRAEIHPETPEKKAASTAEQEAIKAWDDFVTPIREYYGIPRYRPNKEAKR